MGFRVLYYPSIELPNNDWLRRVLLYSDKIATIVPESARHLYKGNTIVELLLENDEFEPILPEDFLNSTELEKENFEREVRGYISNGSFKRFVEESNTGTKRYNYEIYNDKFTRGLVRDFEAQNLIKAIKGNRATIEKDLATLYLGILSKYLGNKYAFTPSTDNPTHEKLIFNISNAQQCYQVANVQLMNCLPVPAKNTSIEDIIKFKRKRITELQSFKIEYLEFQQKLANSESKEEVNHYLELFTTKMDRELRLVSRLLNESRISFTLDSIKSLLNIKIPALFAGATTLPFLLDLDPKVTAATITLGVSYIAARQSLIKKESESPFSYVFHAYKEFGYFPPK
jgi:Family of unknown function (DUF6236)